MTGRILLLAVLSLMAYVDWKEQKVPVCGLLLAGLCGLAVCLVSGERVATDVIAGAGVGVAVLFLAYLTGESIGYGDGMILIVSGILLGFWDVIWLLVTALLLCAAAALFLLVVKRKQKGYRLPFIPFLLLAYLLQLM